MNIEGITTLHALGVLGVEGKDAKSFLQGQVTCNMDDVTASESRLGGHCNLKGRLECLFRVVLIPKEESPLYALIMPKQMIPYAIKDFKKFAMFSKVSFKDLSDTMPVLGLVSNSAPLSSPHYFVQKTPDNLPRYEILCFTPNAFNEKYPPLSEQQWEQWDIENKIPAIYPETRGSFLPHHLNLVELNAISFTKGCYLGQEIIARMHYKGKIKKRLYTATHPGPLSAKPGEPIYMEGVSSSEAPGVVVRSVSSNEISYVLLVLDDSH